MDKKYNSIVFFGDSVKKKCVISRGAKKDKNYLIRDLEV